MAAETLKKRICIIMTFVLCLLSLCADASAATENSGEDTENQKVKVACFMYKGFFEILDDGTYYGYGFDYLDEIAKYTGWEYEYCFGTWQECLEMVENGEVDMMPMVPVTEQRMENMEFTENPTNTGTLSLIAKADSGYAFEDFESFDGMKVGIIDASTEKSVIDSYCKRNDFTIQKKVYSDMKIATEDIQNGKIDAIVTGDLDDIEGYMVLGNVGIQRFYVAAPKGRTDITDMADYALECIQLDDYQFESRIKERYFGNGKSIQPAFSRSELDYIENAGTIKVALYGTRNVLSGYDKDSGQFYGVAYDIMELVSERSGLTFEYIEMPMNVRGYIFFEEGNADIIAPVTVSKYTALSKKVQEISMGATSSLVMVGRRDYAFNADGDFKIVLAKTFFSAENLLKETYPNATFLFADTQEECFDMVVSGEADVTFENRFVALYRMRSPYYTDELTIYESCEENEEIDLILSTEADERLVSILKKSINSITKAEINEIIINNTAQKAYDYSLAELMYQFRYYIVIAIIGIAIIVYLLVFILVLRKRGKKYRIEKEYLEKKRQYDEQYQKQLYHQVNYDSMTGLLNRNGFYEKTRKMLEENPDVKYVILRGDIDQFKVFNDIMGIKMGDELIKYVANMWKEYFVGQLGTYGYLGGDDYICCYPYSLFDEEKVMDAINKWFENYSVTYSFAISLGAYVIDKNNEDIGLMCDRAETALKNAKKNQRTHFCMYDSEMSQQAVKEQEIINYIPTAFEKEQFEIYLQPQYDGATKRIVGAEALTRWNHPEKGMVSPGVFIPIMEENGMITKLDIYVVEHVCRILQELYKKEEMPKDFSIAVNLSRADTFNNDIINQITDIMKKYEIPVTGIRLEITESAYIEQHEQVSDFVRNLKEKGFIIEMDDFGSGYSSLNALKDVPVDTLKLDLRFLAGENSKKGGIIINSVVRMARWLGIPVIAEGVETLEQAEYLKNIGCHYMQGFYFAKPMPVKNFIELLQDNNVETISKGENISILGEIADILDTNITGTVIMEQIGPLAIVEYYQRNLEAVLLNDRFYELIHMDRKDFVEYQLHMQDFISSVNREQLLESIENLKVKQTTVFEADIERDGKKVVLRIRMNVVSEFKGRKAIMMLFDILDY